MSLVRDNISVDNKVSSSVGRTNVTWWRGEEFVGEGESVMIELLVESLVESLMESLMESLVESLVESLMIESVQWWSHCCEI